MSQPHGNGRQWDWYTIMGLVQIGIEVVPVSQPQGNRRQQDWYTIMGLVEVGIEVVPPCPSLMEMGHNRTGTQ